MHVHRGPDPPPGGSLLSMQAHMAQPQSPNTYYPGPDDAFPQQLPPTSKPHFDMPTIDTTFSSYPGSAYGSPQNDSRLGISPAQKGLSVLDAPLPASFDSQGISFNARYGPIAASVPGRLGVESSPPSSVQHRALNESAVRNLHNSAFGTDNRLHSNGLGSSPPTTHDEHIGRRIMHSERYTKPKVMSSSLPKGVAGDDWDENFAFEEELVPNSLQDLLTPQEKMRRFSREPEETNNHLLSQRLSMSGLGTGTPVDSSSKVGSPAASSPSRFSGFFARSSSKPIDTSIDAASGNSSAFGHVGSPLRNSSLHPNASPSLRAASRPASGDPAPFVSSPPRQASMSMITQQLQRTKLASRATSEGNMERTTSGSGPMHLGVARVASGSSVGSSTPGSTGPAPGRMDRVASGTSVYGAGRDRIEEETTEQGLFSMEDEEQLRERLDVKKTPVNGKRTSGAWGFSVGGKNNGFGPIGAQRNNGTATKEEDWRNETG